MAGVNEFGFWIELFGWAGSLLLVVSLVQTRMLRLRVVNLTASVMLVFYNLLVATWPMVGLNAAVVVINAVHIARLVRRPGGMEQPPTVEAGDAS